MRYAIELKDYDNYIPTYNDDGDELSFETEEEAQEYCNNNSGNIVSYRYVDTYTTILTQDQVDYIENKHNVIVDIDSGSMKVGGSKEDLYGWESIPAEWIIETLNQFKKSNTMSDMTTNPFYQSYVADEHEHEHEYSYEYFKMELWIVATRKFVRELEQGKKHDISHHVSEELETVYYDDGATSEQLDEFHNYIIGVFNSALNKWIGVE